MRAKRPPPVFFGTMIACYFVVALILGVIVASFNVSGGLDGALVGLLVWLITAPVGITGHVASDKPMAAFVIDASYQLIYLVMSGAIIAGWR
jgi:hypothetical protein